MLNEQMAMNNITYSEVVHIASCQLYFDLFGMLELYATATHGATIDYQRELKLRSQFAVQDTIFM